MDIARPLLVLCEACGSEGRILTANGNDPDHTDLGECPWCSGTGGELVECEPITLEDLEDAHCGETSTVMADDQLGMNWWNALSERERQEWLRKAGNTGRAKDAWDAFNGRHANFSHCGETNCTFQDGWCKCGMEG